MLFFSLVKHLHFGLEIALWFDIFRLSVVLRKMALFSTIVTINPFQLHCIQSIPIIVRDRFSWSGCNLLGACALRPKNRLRPLPWLVRYARGTYSGLINSS